MLRTVANALAGLAAVIVGTAAVCGAAVAAAAALNALRSVLTRNCGNDGRRENDGGHGN